MVHIINQTTLPPPHFTFSYICWLHNCELVFSAHDFHMKHKFLCVVPKKLVVKLSCLKMFLAFHLCSPDFYLRL